MSASFWVTSGRHWNHVNGFYINSFLIIKHVFVYEILSGYDPTVNNEA
jgi:hypothetical protein